MKFHYFLLIKKDSCPTLNNFVDQKDDFFFSGIFFWLLSVWGRFGAKFVEKMIHDQADVGVRRNGFDQGWESSSKFWRKNCFVKKKIVSLINKCLGNADFSNLYFKNSAAFFQRLVLKKPAFKKLFFQKTLFHQWPPRCTITSITNNQWPDLT